MFKLTMSVMKNQTANAVGDAWMSKVQLTVFTPTVREYVSMGYGISRAEALLNSMNWVSQTLRDHDPDNASKSSLLRR